ncbi:hypothetical protein [Salinicola aestuarinus]|uniref:hypothetical protein n=1 Tax=Salinicola aestuarinus TaxID=1949082 RepID=UPI000DA250B6|nr:hypothetical protein [Salinicola aestuarinus]
MTSADFSQAGPAADTLPGEALTARIATFIGRPVEPLALRWPDSANWLWRDGTLSPQLLKLARNDATQDAFWAGLATLFGLDRWRTPHALTDIAGMLPPQLPMAPLPMTYLGHLDDAPLWSQPWRRGESALMDNAFAGRLGTQLRMLHREAVPGWGHPLSDVADLTTWPASAKAFAESRGAGAEASRLRWPIPQRAVWSLPDQRPDQYLRTATDHFWCDWEALVWAPLEFDLCLVELLIASRAQREAFLNTYGSDTLVDLEHHRSAMRLLARLLALHGPQGETWIDSHPAWLRI